MKRTTGFLALLLCGSALAFDLQGHRGARGLAPENTLGGLARALAVGVHTLELDLALTADGVPVLSHDPALNPDLTRDASGQWLAARGPAIASLTLAELGRYDVGRLRPGSAYASQFAQQQALDGERIPTLDAVFARFRSSGVRFNIEFKTDPGREREADIDRFVDAVLAVVDAHGMRPRVTLQAFDWRPLLRLRERAPDLATACLTTEHPNQNNVADARWTGGLKRADHASVPALVKAAGAAVWSPRFADLDRDRLREAQALGLRVIPWTVNAEADQERLLDWGVDGLITDHPERLRAVMARRGMVLP